MSFFKLPLIFIDAMGMLISSTPPNPPVPAKDQIIPDWRESFLKSLGRPSILLRLTYWMCIIIEVFVILANQAPSYPTSRFIVFFLFSQQTRLQNISVTPLSVLGTLMTFGGTLLRLECYQTLGQFFTFELCISKGHKLIVKGPYAYVRHPSYSALILTIAGAICSASGGSWVRESGVLDTWVGFGAAIVWLTIAASVVLSLLLRIPREDEILRQRFGHEWISWAQRVPYKILPGVY